MKRWLLAGFALVIALSAIWIAPHARNTPPFDPLSATPAAAYSPPWVNFTESGLPAGASWSGYAIGTGVTGVITRGWDTTSATNTTAGWLTSPPSQVTWTVNTTSYGGFAYAPNVTTGSLFVRQNYQTVDITYTKQAGYNLNIITQGLPGYFEPWAGYMTNNQTVNVSWNTFAKFMTFVVPNGTYFYHINESTGGPGAADYMPIPSQGVFGVYGFNYTLTVNFVDVTPGRIYNLKFIPVGLPANTEWFLTFNNTVYSGNGSIYLNISAGEYPLSASSSGYTYTGPLTGYANEYDEVVNVQFAPVNQSTTQGYLGNIFGGVGLTLDNFYLLVLVIASVIITLVAFARTESVMISLIPATALMWVAYLIGITWIGIPLVVSSFAVAAFFLHGRVGIDEGTSPPEE